MMNIEQNCLDLIEAKRNGKEMVTFKEKEPAANMTDLMAALQASIDRTKPKAAKQPAKRKKTARKEIAGKVESKIEYRYF